MYRMVKWSDDLEIESIYHLQRGWRGRYNCDCFAGRKETCRHREMLNWYQVRNTIPGGYFVDYEGRSWIPIDKLIYLCDDRGR